MSSRVEFDERPRPAVLPGGTPVAAATGEVYWDLDDAKVMPTIVPLPEEGDPIYPEGRPVSTRRFDIGCDAQRRSGRFFAVRTAPVGLEIAIQAVLIKRAHDRGRALSTAATAATSALAFPELFMSVRRVGLRPVFADVELDTCYPTAPALGAVADADTELVALPAMYDHLPDLAAIRAMCDRLGLGFVLCVARMPKPRWQGLHAATYPDITVVEGQSGGEMSARVVTFDPMLAAIVAMLCNAAGAPEPLPDWWPSEPVPDVSDTLPTTGAEAPVGKLVVPGTLDGDLTSEWLHRHHWQILRQHLARRPDLPWSMLPEQTGVDGGVHRAGLIFDPSTSYKPEAWKAIGRKWAGRLLAVEVTTAIYNGYPLPDELASVMDRFPNARYLSDHMHLVSPRFPERNDAPRHLFEAMCKLHWWADHPELQARVCPER